MYLLYRSHHRPSANLLSDILTLICLHLRLAPQLDPDRTKINAHRTWSSSRVGLTSAAICSACSVGRWFWRKNKIREGMDAPHTNLTYISLDERIVISGFSSACAHITDLLAQSSGKDIILLLSHRRPKLNDFPYPLASASRHRGKNCAPSLGWWEQWLPLYLCLLHCNDLASLFVLLKGRVVSKPMAKLDSFFSFF